MRTSRADLHVEKFRIITLEAREKRSAKEVMLVARRNRRVCSDHRDVAGSIAFEDRGNLNDSESTERPSTHPALSYES